MPNAIANAPDLHLGLEAYFEAYMDLCSCRGGMGDGPIPWTAIHEYCQRLEFDEETCDDMLFYVRVMDDTWLAYQKEKRNSKTGR